MRKAAGRAALIGVMLAGGVLYAGISQAQDANVQEERAAELIAASGGPSAAAHLIPFEADKAAVEVRDDDVAAAAPGAAAPVSTPNTGPSAAPAVGVVAVSTAPSSR